VLDTFCVRGTPKPALAALIDAGFELRVPDWVTTSRLAAEFGPPDGIPEKQLIQLAAMMFLDGAVGQVTLPGKPSAKQRFDAYGKLAGFHAAPHVRVADLSVRSSDTFSPGSPRWAFSFGPVTASMSPSKGSRHGTTKR